MNRPMNHIENPMKRMKHNDTAHETAHDTARNLMNRSGHHLEPLEPTMNHIGNPMTNLTHHEPAHDTASKLLEPEGPTFLFQQTCPRRSTGSAPAAIAAVRQVAISTPVHGITSRGTRLTEKAEENRIRDGGKKEERDYMSRPLTERRKEISLGWKKGKNKRR